MPTTPSKFASWSIVASATVLAVAIITAAVLLRPACTPLAAAPIQPEVALLLTPDQFNAQVIRSTSYGWLAHDAFLTHAEATNRAYLNQTLSPKDLPPLDMKELLKRRLAAQR